MWDLHGISIQLYVIEICFNWMNILLFYFIFQTNATCPICRVEVKVWTQNKVCLFGPEQLNCRSSLVGRGTFLQYLFGDELELLSFIVCMHGLWVNQYVISLSVYTCICIVHLGCWNRVDMLYMIYQTCEFSIIHSGMLNYLFS